MTIGCVEKMEPITKISEIPVSIAVNCYLKCEKLYNNVGVHFR